MRQEEDKRKNKFKEVYEEEKEEGAGFFYTLRFFGVLGFRAGGLNKKKKQAFACFLNAFTAGND